MWSAHQGSQTSTPSSTFQVVPFFGFFISDFIFEIFFQLFSCVLETFSSDTEIDFRHFFDFQNIASRICSRIPVLKRGWWWKWFACVKSKRYNYTISIAVMWDTIHTVENEKKVHLNLNFYTTFCLPARLSLRLPTVGSPPVRIIGAHKKYF